MKKVILIVLLLAGTLLQAKETLRDSIFRVTATQPTDTLRIKFLRNALQQQIGQPSAVEYLDSALALSIRKQIHEEELWTLFDYCRHYEYCTDQENMLLYFSKLKDASYRYKSYPLYYTVWLSILQKRCAQGDTEYAIMQAEEMRAEAIRLKFDSGIFVASMATAQAYNDAGENEKAIAAYKQTLEEYPDANYNSRLIIHGNLAEIYQREKQYPQALAELQYKLDAIKKIIEGQPLSGTYKTVFLETEIAFSTIYLELKDETNVKKHLEKAAEYYDKNSFLGGYIDYHALWGGYYRLIKKWNKCFKEYDLALSACRGDNPFRENSILKKKAEALMEAGSYKKAAELYKKAIARGDSLNEAILQRNNEMYEANYEIQRALLEKEDLTKEYRILQVGSGAVILLILLFVMMRNAHIKGLLRQSEKETRQAYETITATDKMKECFLHNITFEIRIPMNSVVGFSELLSLEKGLTEEEIQEYSAVIKKSSVKLLALINNILDLSRLEAGMMRFNVQACDAVQLCKEAKMMIGMQTTDGAQLNFHTNIDELTMQADSKWFLRLLTTLFTLPEEYAGEPCKVDYTLSKAGNYLTIVVKGSPLYLCWEDEQEQRILHDINRLYVETFSGNYQILGKDKEKLVSITYPIFKK